MRRALAALAAAATICAVAAPAFARTEPADPIKLLIITGDEYHDWKATSDKLKEIFSEGGLAEVDITSTPAKDLTPENLAKYDAFLINYRPTKPTPETEWSEANKKALLDAVKGGKGLMAYHFASSGFTKPNWDEYETMLGGGWRTQGFHGPAHEFTVKKTDADHPISKGLPAEFDHVVDELYQNSKMVEGNTVLATAYSDPDKPKGTGKDEAIIWVRTYGDGRVYHNVMGHDVKALDDPNLQAWLRRGLEWVATGEVKAG